VAKISKNLARLQEIEETKQKNEFSPQKSSKQIKVEMSF
jgi:hypothetical protein